MFNLRPPGSFPLCTDPAYQEVAVGDLQSLVNLVLNTVQPYPVLGVLLTGSVARGEGTLVADNETGTRWLGNLECWVVFRAEPNHPAHEIEEILRQAQAACNADPANRRRGLKVGFNPILAPQLRRLRPSIFSRELLEHGKLLWGDLSVLTLPRWWSEGRIEIPRQDAFRLLNNRIMQQLAARALKETGAGEPLSAEYAINKFWIELSTSLSVFAGCYRSSYRERQRTIEDFLSSGPPFLGPELAQMMALRLREAMAVKLGKAPTPLESAHHAFDEAALVAQRLWDWESSQLLGVEAGRSDWRSVIGRLRRLETLSQRARDWGRLFVRQRSARFLKPGVAALLNVALRAGSFATAIYGAGCLLEFYWDEIASERKPGLQISRQLAKLLNVTNLSNGASRRILVEAAVMAWDHHLRLAAI